MSKKLVSVETTYSRKYGIPLKNRIVYGFVFVCKVWGKKTAHFWKLAINKKSTFFVQSAWNLVKIFTLRDNHFHKVSWGSDKKCRFFINGQFLNVSFFYSDLRRESQKQRKCTANIYSQSTVFIQLDSCIWIWSFI